MQGSAVQLTVLLISLLVVILRCNSCKSPGCSKLTPFLVVCQPLNLSSLFVCSSRSDPSFNGPFILVGVVSDILFSTNITNAGPDAAYNVILTFTHPTSLTFSRVEGEAQFTCTTNQNADVTTCSVVSVLGIERQVCCVFYGGGMLCVCPVCSGVYTMALSRPGHSVCSMYVPVCLVASSSPLCGSPWYSEWN